MIHVSSEFREQMEMRTDFKEQAEVTFLDGTKLSLTENDFTVSNNSITDGAGSNGLPLGAAIQRQIQIELIMMMITSKNMILLEHKFGCT